jgi:hypothetical protein
MRRLLLCLALGAGAVVFVCDNAIAQMDPLAMNDNFFDRLLGAYIDEFNPPATPPATGDTTAELTPATAISPAAAGLATLAVDRLAIWRHAAHRGRDTKFLRQQTNEGAARHVTRRPSER